jgi:diguanylate cyclase (GGDEF)-like protein
MLGFDDKIIGKILDLVVSEIAHTADLFGFYIKNQKPVEEILQEANEALLNINLTYDHVNRELIDATVQLQQLTKELEENNKRLEKLTLLDSLTEVYNHGCFQSILENQVSIAARKNLILSLLMVDVDYFKSFNDNYGHQAGDFILKELCKLMKKSLRDYDMLFRYGGEEFAIILPEITGQEAQIVAEKLRESIAMHTFIINNKKYNVTVSIGLAEIEPAVCAFTKNDLINFADKALFESKDKGRNKVTLYGKKNI